MKTDLYFGLEPCERVGPSWLYRIEISLKLNNRAFIIILLYKFKVLLLHKQNEVILFDQI